MSVTRIKPPLELTTSRGKGWAHFLIDYGQEHDLLWVVFLADGGACWTFRNPEVRMPENLTMGTTCEQFKPDARTGL